MSISIRQIEHRQWWLWASAAVVTLLLTAGIVSLALPVLFAQGDPYYSLRLTQSVRGLVGVVLLFDIYAAYQQLQIHRIRHRLHEREKLFRLISENAADMIALVDVQGRRIYNSPAYQKVLGYSAEELKGTSAFEQIHPADRQRVTDAAEEARRTGVGRRLEYRLRHKDGTWRVLESTASAVRNAQGQIECLVIVNRDITERKDLEQQFRQAQKMEAVGRLSGGLAHDFNNLMAVIIGYSEVLQERLDKSDTLGKCVEEIKKAGQRAASLTRQLLAFSRQQVLEPRILDLNAVVTDTMKMLRRLIGEDIELETVLDPALGRVKADQGQIEQVVMNLAVNARDAMPQGGKLIIESANAAVDEAFARRHPPMVPGDYVMLAVTDTGIGMDEKTQAHIFEPFFTTKEPGKGTGLGLATVYGVVKQSGGYIWVYSELEQGTTFRIYLPLVNESIPAGRQSTSSDRSLQGSETILLVEDEESLRRLTRTVLAESGYTVLEARNGTQGLEVAHQHRGPIHLLLTDMVMPGMSGPALAEKLASLHPETKVLYMSGHTEYGISDSGNLDWGAVFLQKPFTRASLAQKMREVLDGTASSKQPEAEIQSV